MRLPRGAMAAGDSAVIAEPRSSQLLLCRVQTYLCALPLENVIETMRPLPTERLAATPESVLGLAVIRGAPTPVVDLGRLLSGQDPRPGRWVTIRTGARQVALAVDEALGVRGIERRSLQELPPLLRDAGGDIIAAISSLDAELLFVLQTVRIVPDDVFDALDARKPVS